jgi:hypothetical protein
MNSKRISQAVVVVLLLSMGTATSVAAGSDPACGTAVAAARSVDITSTADALLAPDRTAPGPVTFQVRTTDEGSGWVGLARVNEGTSTQQFLTNLRRTASSNRTDIIEGSRDLLASSQLLGGVVIHPGQPGSFSQLLRRGDYQLFDYKHLLDTPPRLRTLTVGGNTAGSETAACARIVSRYVPGSGPRYEVTGTVRTGRPIEFAQKITGQIAEAVFFPLTARITAADLEAYFAKFVDGSAQFPPDPPFDLGAGLGALPLSPGQSAVIRIPLNPGRYVVLGFIKDATDGRMLVKKGQYKIVQVG